MFLVTNANMGLCLYIQFKSKGTLFKTYKVWWTPCKVKIIWGTPMDKRDLLDKISQIFMEKCHAIAKLLKKKCIAMGVRMNRRILTKVWSFEYFQNVLSSNRMLSSNPSYFYWFPISAIRLIQFSFTGNRTIACISSAFKLCCRQ